MKNIAFAALLCALFLLSSRADCQVVFANWTAANDAANTAAGTLGSSAVSLTTDMAVPDFSGNGGVVGGILDGSYTNFSGTNFVPNIASTDAIGLGSASSFTLRFSPPVTNPVLHLYQLADNTWSFGDGTAPLSFTLISSDGTFTIPTGSVSTTITGRISQTDSSGSLAFHGVFSRISWVSSAGNTSDGVVLQVSVSTPLIQFQPGAVGFLNSKVSGLLPGQTLVWQGSTNLSNWTPLQTNTTIGQTFSITNSINPAIAAQFFRASVP
jgi:hypothetical protein